MKRKLDELSKDELGLIFQELPAKDVISLSSTCKRLRASTPWAKLLWRDFGVTDEVPETAYKEETAVQLVNSKHELADAIRDENWPKLRCCLRRNLNWCFCYTAHCWPQLCKTLDQAKVLFQFWKPPFVSVLILKDNPNGAKIVKLLLDHDVPIPDYHMYDMLRYPDGLKVILDHNPAKADLYLVDHALSSKHLESALLLLPHVEPNTYTLWRACREGLTEVVEQILPRVDPTHNDFEALAIAHAYGHNDVVKLLLADPRVNLPKSTLRVLFKK